MTKSLPPRPDIEWLKKAAKDRLAELRSADASAKLYQAQLAIARDYGFASWRALSAHVKETGVDGQIVRAAIEGNAQDLLRLLDEYPKKLRITGGSLDRPLLHLAAERGHKACVALLLARGMDVNTRDRQDNATALHWAAQASELDMVRELLDAGADIEGQGDLHELGVLGWAIVMSPRREVAELLLARGATPTVFAAVALGREDLVRKLVDENSALIDAQLSHHERHQTPLHLAVARGRAEMVRLLIELGADVSARDSRGATPMQYATRATDPRIAELLVEAGADPAVRRNFFESATPQLEVSDVPSAIAYFVEKLGFEKEWEAGHPPSFACVYRDDVFIFLSAQHRGLGRSYVALVVRDVDALFEEYRARGAKILRPPVDQRWGGRQMVVEGPDGNLIGLTSMLDTARSWHIEAEAPR